MQTYMATGGFRQVSLLSLGLDLFKRQLVESGDLQGLTQMIIDWIL